MKIKEIKIKNYGDIIKDRYFKPSEKIHIVYGPNESGKTLSVEAITRMLFKWRYKDFQLKPRILESPSGSIIIQKDNGEDVTLDGNKNFPNEFKIDKIDVENVFVIRNSELNFDIKYCTDITDRLIGFEARNFEEIKKEIAKYGKLVKATSDSELSNKADKGSPQTYLFSLERISKDIKEYLDDQKYSEIDVKEGEALLKSQKLEELNKKLEELEISKKKKNYLTSSSKIKELNEVEERLQDLSIFTVEDYNVLLEIYPKYTHTLGEIDGLNNSLKSKKKNLEELNKEKEDLLKISNPHLSKKEIFDHIKYDALNIADEEKNLPAVDIKNNNKIGYALMGISLILFVVSLLIGKLLFIVFPLVIFVLGFYTIIRKVSSPRDKIYSKKRSLIEKSCLSLGISCDSYNDMLSKLSEFGDKLKDYEKELNNINNNKINPLNSSIQTLNEEFEKKEITKDGYWDKIKAIQDKTNVKDFDEYKKKYDERIELINNKEKIYSNLDELFDTKDLDNNSKIDIWKSKIEELSKYKDEEVMEYNGEEEEKIKAELRNLKVQFESLNHVLEDHRNKLKEFENDIAKFDIVDKISNLTVLEDIKKILDSKITDIENKKILSQQAIGIIEEIEREERGKTTELFGKDKEVAKLFNRITDGKFISVELDNGESKKEIKVVKHNGDEIKETHLSKGTFDQLYLSIRLAIGEKLLRGYKGFFIMDDPFVFSDITRLKEQFNILDKMANEQWNILYFTSKDEVKQLAQERGYTLQELDPLP